MFWVISVYFNIRNTLQKFCPFLLGHSVYIFLSDSVTSRVKRQKSSGLVKSIGGNQGAEMANYKYVVAMRERIFSREGFKWKRL